MNELMELSKILGKKFTIPSYQRGYRWQADYEVQELLEDLYEFFEKKIHDESSYYCMQPLVVKRDLSCSNDGYIVVDGQQRLTTFSLIYKVLFNKDMFDLTYVTRESSNDFIKNIDMSSQLHMRDNIDFYHIYNAYVKIKNWLNDDGKVELFKNNFLTKAKIIWYEIPNDEDEIAVFLRLNIGKIPLTNAELIKALFLSKTDTEQSDELKKRARLWYDCEIKTRSNNDKTYCLYNNISHENVVFEKTELSDDITRIEMFFSVLCNIKNTSEEPHAIFKHYYNLVCKSDKRKIWKEFEKCQSILLSLANPTPDDYVGRILYHLLGFLIYCENYTVQDLWFVLKNKTTNQEIIIKMLEDRIINKFKNVELSQLSYLENRKILEQSLLLFNLVDLNTKIGNRKDFEFNRYKMQFWSLEHIIPQNLKNKKDKENLILWLNDIENFSRDEKLVDEIYDFKKNIIKHDNIDDIIKNIEEKLLNHFEDIHSISNLVLLDRDSNASLSNENFSSKRAKIKELYMTNRLIPQCTGEVFEKTYSTEKGDPDVWTKHDRDKYFEHIKAVLKDYIQG